jgi:hypothetical protein
MHRDIAPDLGRRQLFRTVLALVGIGAGALVTKAVRRTGITELAPHEPLAGSSARTTATQPGVSVATEPADSGGMAPTPPAPSTPSTSTLPNSTTPTSAMTETDTTKTTTTSTTVPPAAETLAVTVFCQDAWGARAAQSGFESHSVSRLTVHHTARNLDDPSDGPGAIRGHQRFHIEDRGWPDLAYHYIVSTDGNAFEGRSEQYRGDTGTSYDPSGHFLVCLEGDFDQQSPTEAQIDTVCRLLAYAASKYNVTTATLGGHRDYAGTSCPGDAAYSLISDGSLAERVDAYVEAGTMERLLSCGPEATAAVKAIEA